MTSILTTVWRVLTMSWVLTTAHSKLAMFTVHLAIYHHVFHIRSHCYLTFGLFPYEGQVSFCRLFIVIPAVVVLIQKFERMLFWYFCLYLTQTRAKTCHKGSSIDVNPCPTWKIWDLARQTTRILRTKVPILYLIYLEHIRQVVPYIMSSVGYTKSTDSNHYLTNIYFCLLFWPSKNHIYINYVTDTMCCIGLLTQNPCTRAIVVQNVCICVFVFLLATDEILCGVNTIVSIAAKL